MNIPANLRLCMFCVTNLSCVLLASISGQRAQAVTVPLAQVLEGEGSTPEPATGNRTAAAHLHAQE